MEAKKKISRFEFAIMSVADPESLDQFESYTEEEELQMRKDKLMKQAEDLNIQSH